MRVGDGERSSTAVSGWVQRLVSQIWFFRNKGASSYQTSPDPIHFLAPR
ncbi:hypothetical protein [Rubritalea tangerina]